MGGGDEDFDAIAAGVFGAVEGAVGEFDDGRGDDGAEVGDAEAAGDGDGGVVVEEGNVLDGEAEALGEAGGFGGLGVGEQDGEFLSAVAADDVIRAAVGGEGGGDETEGFVAETVAMVVVDGFEVIDVGHDAGEEGVVAFGVGEFCGEAGVEVGAGSRVR